MSGDPEQEYFADGMVEDIITALSHFKALFVIARNSSFTYKGRAVDVKQVGRELGVRYVLEGSVRKAGNRVRITGQLVDTATGAHLWAERFDGGLGDIFDLQDQVTESVVGAIAPAVVKAEIERARRKPTESPFDYIVIEDLARLCRLEQGGNEEALRCFDRRSSSTQIWAWPTPPCRSATLGASHLAGSRTLPRDSRGGAARATRARARQKRAGHSVNGRIGIAYLEGDLDLVGAAMDRALD